MKTLSTALATHLESECTTTCYLVKLTRVDGVVRAYTNHDQDVIMQGVLYKADGAFNPSALVSSYQLNPDNLSITGLISDAEITDQDLHAGYYDHARCDVYLCNWADLSQGVIQLRRGWLGEIKFQDNRYNAALHGLHDRLQQEFGHYYTATCRHALGDSHCTIDLASYTVTGTVTSGTNSQQFYDTAQMAVDGWFDNGKLVWTSGANNGLAMEVQHWSAINHQFSLWLAMPQVPQSGDTYRVTAGCDKRFSICKTKFNNRLNFGGFPHMPGVDKILATPNAQA